MIERSQLVEVSIASLRITTMQFLSQLQHVIRITGFRTINVGYEVLAGLLTGEVFTTRVTTESQRTFTGNNIPEISTGSMISLVTRQLTDTFETYDLRYLRIGMHIVQTVLTLFQWQQESFVGETFGNIQIFLITSNSVCIGQHFIHATMLCM